MYYTYAAVHGSCTRVRLIVRTCARYYYTYVHKLPACSHRLVHPGEGREAVVVAVPRAAVARDPQVLALVAEVARHAAPRLAEFNPRDLANTARGLLSSYRSLPPTRHSPLPTLHLPLAIRHSPLTTCHSSLATATFYSLLATCHVPRATVYLLLTPGRRRGRC